MSDAPRLPTWAPEPDRAPGPFSDAELARRHAAVLDAAQAAGCDRIVAYGANRNGSAIPWLTRWPVTREAVALIGPDHPDVLVVQFHNHTPLAAELARDAQVVWGGTSTIDTVVEQLRQLGGDRQTLGLIGDVPYQVRDALAEAFGPPVDLGPAYTRLRTIKSDEEIEHLRHGARLSDRALAGLVAGLQPGANDRELIDAMERAYVPHGGTTHIHYLSVTDMADPDRCVPAQQPVGATVARGSVAVTEISAAFRGYAGQVLRTLTVGEPPNARYAELHDAAQAAFDAVLDVLRDGTTPAEVVAAARSIEDAGFELCDDLLHGFGGGYLPPVIGRFGEPVPDLPLRTGMTVVVQPNVVTPDRRAGVQTGELVVITDDGAVSLHTAPRGVIEVALPTTSGGAPR